MKFKTFKRKITLLLVAITICAHSAVAQKTSCCTDRWIDKEEDVNYTPRHECSFVQAGDQFILFGGRESAQKMDLYNFKNNRWDTGGKAPREFNHFQATTYEGFVWVIGAYKTNTFPHESPADFIWLYFPPTKQWIKGPEIPKERRRGGAGLVLYKDMFYLIAGSTNGHDGGYVSWCDMYDPINNTWKKLEDAPRARDHFHAAIIDKKVYAAGGRLSGGEGGAFAPLVDTVDVFDLETRIWSSVLKPLPTPRAAPGIAVLEKELYVMGGEGEKHGPAFKIVEAYKPADDVWTRKADMHYPRHGTQAIQSGTGIYIACGSPNRGGGNQLNMEVYNSDNANGEPLLASQIFTPKEITIPIRSSKSITIKNEEGNTGSFIQSVEIIDDEKNNFSIKHSLDLTLLKVNATGEINISHKGKKANQLAYLRITYNGDSQKLVKIISR